MFCQASLLLRRTCAVAGCATRVFAAHSRRGAGCRYPLCCPSSAACAGQGTPQYYQTRRPSEPQVGSTICLDKTYLLDTGVCVCVAHMLLGGVLLAVLFAKLARALRWGPAPGIPAAHTSHLARVAHAAGRGCVVGLPCVSGPALCFSPGALRTATCIPAAHSSHLPAGDACPKPMLVQLPQSRSGEISPQLSAFHPLLPFPPCSAAAGSGRASRPAVRSGQPALRSVPCRRTGGFLAPPLQRQPLVQRGGVPNRCVGRHSCQAVDAHTGSM